MAIRLFVAELLSNPNKLRKRYRVQHIRSLLPHRRDAIIMRIGENEILNLGPLLNLGDAILGLRREIERTAPCVNQQAHYAAVQRRLNLFARTRADVKALLRLNRRFDFIARRQWEKH